MKYKIFIAVLILIFLSGCAKQEVLSQDKTPVNFTIAFVSDTAVNNNSNKVYQMIKDEGADMVLHTGDLMHVNNSAEVWDNQISSILGEDFPLFAVTGNHDQQDRPSRWPDFQKKLEQRLGRINGAECVGTLGLRSACSYKGILFVLTGYGIRGPKFDYHSIPFPFSLSWKFGQIPYTAVASYISNYLHERFIKKELKDNENFKWKICLWHKNQRLMQVGGKPDVSEEAGGKGADWDAYEICRKAGAFVVNGHTHTYARSYLMSNFENQVIASHNSTLNLEKGKSFVVVPSLGGQGNREQDDELAKNPWWASVYTATQNATYSALFCIFNLNGNEDKAECYYKNINNEIVDRFNLTTNS